MIGVKKSSVADPPGRGPAFEKSTECGSRRDGLHRSDDRAHEED
jgi:hypothetical protein